MLQLYIMGTQYTQYKDLFQLTDLTLGNIIFPSTSGSNARLAMQVKK